MLSRIEASTPEIRQKIPRITTGAAVTSNGIRGK
jgi:hypothetical protein